MSPTVYRAFDAVRVPVKKTVDLSAVLRATRGFYSTHKLEALSKALPSKIKLSKDAEAAFGRAGTMGMEPTLVLPPASVQHEHLARIISATASAPCDALPAEQQYLEPLVQDLAGFKAATPKNRPATMYMLCLAFGPFESDTTGQHAKALDKLFEADEVCGLTVPEYLLLQRLRAIEHGDHQFDEIDPAAGAGYESGWQCLTDTRTKDSVAIGGWNAHKRRIELGWAKCDAKHAKRGAHRTVIVEVVAG